MSFEGISFASYKTEESFAESFINQLKKYLNFNKIDFINKILENKRIANMNNIDLVITEIAENTENTEKK
ncbi:hypothetical protein SAMN02745207_03609 [Clostridium grantii DSM 8605]|uniref:Uncharacterized protein n=1 Tax=Clostridium grantii DSM 8605 TaxID=1121316 RepID=A0A1M5XFM5_9CLOT|nr:hypothetical protein SAMN02745207_03609 [Clostridium grantii DSM 8605]